MAYTAQHLAELRANIARGVKTLKLNGEEVTFRDLDEMFALEAKILRELDPCPAPGFHLPTFSRG